MPVCIVIQKRRARAEARVPHAGRLRHVGELAIPFVPVENVCSEVRDVDVRIAVRIIVSTGAAHRITGIPHSSRVGHIHERTRAIALVAIQAIARPVAAWSMKTSTLHEVHVEKLVAIVVEQADASTHDLRQVKPTAVPGRMTKTDTRLGKHIFKPWSGRICRRWSYAAGRLLRGQLRHLHEK